MNTQPKKFNKTKQEYIYELMRSLKLIEHSLIQLARTDEDFHIDAIISALRPLIVTGGSGQKPFLLDISDEYSCPLILYSFEEKKNPPAVGIIAEIYACQTWSTVGVTKYTLREWIMVPSYFDLHQKKYVSRNEIVKLMANNSVNHHGPAFSSIEETLDRQFGSKGGGRKAFAIDTAKAVLYCGKKFLRLLELRERGDDPNLDHELVVLDAEFGTYKSPMGIITLYGHN